jgi:hypothetical protein
MDPGPVLIKGKVIEANAAGAWVKLPVSEGKEFTATLTPELAKQVGADAPDTDVLIPAELLEVLAIGDPRNPTEAPVAQVKFGELVHFVSPDALELPELSE